MNKSEEIKNIASALSAFQGEVKSPPKSADNPYFKSKYAPLDAIIDTAKPILQKNGLSFVQSCSGDGSFVTVTTLLMHSSGEWIESEPLTLKTDKATAQGAGSAITYARRYGIAAFLGLAAETDDDGNAAEPSRENKKKQEEPPQTRREPPAKKRETPPDPPKEEPKQTPTQGNGKDKITMAQAKRLFALAKGNVDLVKTACDMYGYTSSKDVLVKDYAEIADQIEKTAKNMEQEEIR